MRRTPCLVVVLITTATVGSLSPAQGEDWPCFRGPRHDGVSRETGLKTDWAAPIPRVWDRSIGSGFSGMSCVDGRLYTGGTRDRRQSILCLNADTGKVIWQKEFEKQFKDGQGGDGPRATPTVDDGRVYMLGGHGRLVCFDAAGGKELWTRQLRAVPTWGYSGSVLIEGNLAVVSAGGNDGSLLALDKKSGKEVWKAGRDPVGYATPYPFTHQGRRLIAGFCGDSALIVDARTGQELWRMPWKTDYNVNASSPIYHDGNLFFSSGYRHGCIVLKLRPGGDRLAADTVWESKVLRNKFQSCILYEGHLYTSDEIGLKCVEFATGKEKWQKRRMEHGTVVLAGDDLFFLTQRGELQIGKASPEGFKPRTQAELLNGRCWTVSTLYGGRIYVRDLDRLACFDLTERGTE